MNPANDQRILVFCAGVAALIYALTACDSPPRQQLPPPAVTTASTSVVTPPTSAVEVASRPAVAAYLGMWRDFSAASHTSDWRAPALGTHATGAALTTMTRGLYADHANNLVSHGEPQDTPQVSLVRPLNSPTTVVVSDCGDDSGWRHYRASDGALANTGPNGRRQINAVVQKQSDGLWRVTDFGVQAVGTC